MFSSVQLISFHLSVFVLLLFSVVPIAVFAELYNFQCPFSAVQLVLPLYVFPAPLSS